jgi:hypothetical protein
MSAGLALASAMATMERLPPVVVPRAFTDADFALDYVRDNGTTPRTVTVRLIHVHDGRPVDLCVWLDGDQSGNGVSTITKSVYVGSCEAVRAWAQSSEIVRRAVRRFR